MVEIACHGDAASVLLAVAGTLVLGRLMTRSAPNVASPDQHVVPADRLVAKPIKAQLS
jgi:hypothetical protein